MTRAAPGQISVAKWSQSKSPNTRYTARQTIRLPDGTSRRIEAYGRRQRDAIEKCQAKAREVAQRAASANTVTVDQLFARLASEKKSLGRKAKTLHNLLGDYRRHIQPHIGSTPIAEITFEQLQAIQQRLTRQGKYRTAQLVTDILKSSYKFALRSYRKEIHEGRVRLLDLAQDLPTVQTPERKRVAQGLWSLAELNAFLDAAEEDYRVSKNLYYPLYLTACSAGLRRGELLGLPKAAVGRAVLEQTSSSVAYLDVTTQLVYYGGKHHRETPKSDAGERRMYIPESLYRFISDEHLPRLEQLARSSDWLEHGLLFPTLQGRPISPSSLYRHRNKLCQRLGLNPIRLHDLRKIYSTRLTAQLIEEGNFTPKNLMLALGHNDPVVAVRDYMQAIEDRKERTVVEIRRS